MKALKMLALVSAIALPMAIVAQQQGPPRGAAPAAAPCVPGGQYVCGQTAPEDLVLVPGGEWVVASMYGGAGGVQIISTKDKTSTMAYPTATAKEELDKKTYDTCPGPLSAAEKMQFRTHGLRSAKERTRCTRCTS